MATYIIGDVQGCFDELQLLLKHIKFDPQQDQLGFVGDLVSRGPKSLETLRFIKSLDNPLVVLGNHDLHLLALGHGVIHRNNTHSLAAINTAPDREELLHWLAQQAIMMTNHEEHFVLVHAGIPPQWDVATAQSYADELSAILKSDQCIEFLDHMYGDQPDTWSDALTGWDRLRYITNAFTRMRFCSASGRLVLNNKT